MRIVDALDMYEDADGREDAYKHRIKVKGHKRDRKERRELAQARKEVMSNG